MFLVKTRNPSENGSQELNNIQIVKLKNKLGTRGLPTAELILDGTEADLVSEPGRGVASISHMLTITRMYNTLGSAVAMRRCVRILAILLTNKCLPISRQLQRIGCLALQSSTSCTRLQQI